jgi:FkbM family methyltransferase
VDTVCAPVKKDSATGLWYRHGTWDLDAIRRADEFARCVEPGDVVLDLGAHVGSTVRIAVQAEAKKVVAYEPEPEAFKILRQNTLDDDGESLPQVELHLAAVVGEVATGLGRLAVNPQSTIGHTLMAKAWTGDARRVSVKTERFEDVVAAVQPTVLKVDVEGAETEYDWAILPDSVRCLLVELHLRGPADWPTRAKATYQRLIDAGWFPNDPPPDERFQWNATYIMRRPVKTQPEITELAAWERVAKRSKPGPRVDDLGNPTRPVPVAVEELD